MSELLPPERLPSERSHVTGRHVPDAALSALPSEVGRLLSTKHSPGPVARARDEALALCTSRDYAAAAAVVDTLDARQRLDFHLLVVRRLSRQDPRASFQFLSAMRREDVTPHLFEIVSGVAHRSENDDLFWEIQVFGLTLFTEICRGGRARLLTRLLFRPDRERAMEVLMTHSTPETWTKAWRERAILYYWHAQRYAEARKLLDEWEVWARVPVIERILSQLSQEGGRRVVQHFIRLAGVTQDDLGRLEFIRHERIQHIAERLWECAERTGD